MKRRDLSEEERALWRRAVRDVAPARRARAAASAPHKPKSVKAQAASAGAPASRRANAKAPVAARDLAKKEPRAFGAGDPKRDRAAGGKRLPVERTLDLHGLTQAEAHRRLVRFLNAASADGARLTLVITGQ
ncbi:MAG: Smr/MutS family protein, partial [Pseudomonadota bacterium]